MTARTELHISPRRPESAATIVHAIEQFVRRARIDEMPSALMRPTPSGLGKGSCGAELRAELKSYTGSTARKAVELPSTGANPKRITRWLGTSAAHVSPVFSPLKERGPPAS